MTDSIHDGDPEGGLSYLIGSVSAQITSLE